MTASKPWGLRIAALLLLTCAFAVFVAKPIDLSNSDIGRHIVNGRLVATEGRIPSTNLFSYTYPDYPFVNHHWGGGLLFYLVYRLAGFKGLSVLYVALDLIAFLLFFMLAWKRSSFETALLFALLFLPLAASRMEVRPEGVSLFLLAFVTSLLVLQRDGDLPLRSLWFLPAAMVVWVNSHIYFFLGDLVIDVFFAEALVRTPPRRWTRDTRTRTLFAVLVVSKIALFINPFGWRGVVAPFVASRSLGYDVAEADTFMHLAGLVRLPIATYAYAGYALALGAWAVGIARGWRRPREFPVAVFLFWLFTAVTGLLAIRNLALFGSFSILAAATATGDPVKLLRRRAAARWRGTYSYAVFALAGVGLWALEPAYCAVLVRTSGVGLAANGFGLGRFLIDHNVRGPIMNNFDIGGELIFALYPRERVFVDNRSEAYPASFFSQTYIPMQQDEARWRDVDQRFHFNAIVYNRHDFTAWGQQFLIRRTFDPEWAPVFVDQSSIVLLRRNGTNADIIRSFEIPQSRFGVGHE